MLCFYILLEHLLHKVVPMGVEALLRTPGLGPGRVKSLCHSRGIGSVKQLQQREAYDVDMTRIIKQAKARGCFLELKSQPLRFDPNEFYCRMAHDEGVLANINSDAHAKQNFDYLQYGVDHQARSGWLEKKDVLNTLPLKELRALLRRTMT